jgi:hypothetical protein
MARSLSLAAPLVYFFSRDPKPLDAPIATANGRDGSDLPVLFILCLPARTQTAGRPVRPENADAERIENR